MLKMGFQDMVVGARLRSTWRYEKLSNHVDEKAAKQGRCFWMKRANGRLKGIKLSRSRKLTLKVFSVVVFTSRIVKMCNELVNRLSIDHGVCPNMIFTTHWGLPVLSHSSLKCSRNKRVLH